MADVSALSIATAYLRGHSIYELRLSNWGNIGAAADAASLRVSIDRPILGAAISPDSDVPACIITRALGPISPVPIITTGAVLSPDVVLNKGAPLLFQQGAPLTVAVLGQDVFDDAYTTEAGVSTPFGTTLPLTVFGAPTLKVLLLLSGTGLLVSPRNAFNVQGTHVFVGGVEELIYAIPTLGRRTVRITARTEVGTSVTLRATGIVGRWFDPPIGANVDNTKEVQLGTIAIGALATGTILLTDPEVQWVLVKATRTGGANDVTWTARASD